MSGAAAVTASSEQSVAGGPNDGGPARSVSLAGSDGLASVGGARAGATDGALAGSGGVALAGSDSGALAGLDELAERVRSRLPPDRAVLDDHELVAHIRQEAPLLPPAQVDLLRRLLGRHVGRLGSLDELCSDPDVTDVLVNGHGDVWVERRGQLERTGVVLTLEERGLLIERIVSPLGLRADRTSPVVDARLPDGSRVCVVLPPLSPDGPLVCIRRFAARTLALDSFGPPAVVGLLTDLVAGRRNVVVYGPTGAGKTTLLGSLAAHFPSGERVVTIEDCAELRLPGEQVVRLEARPANSEGAGQVTMRHLVRTALRLRPDRIVVGEVRGPEALDMLAAISTGHAGSMSTCHADGPLDALGRLETMVLLADVGLPLPAVRRQLGTAVHALVGVRRHPDGRRQVAQVHDVGIGRNAGPAEYRLRRRWPPTESQTQGCA